ncbi:MAG: multiheme c-type cytochrome [Acidobacteriota bacterium]
MKRTSRLLTAAAFLFLCLSALSSNQGFGADVAQHSYIGVGKCKMCHMSKAKGAQYARWAQTKHAKAYATLASEEAKKFAAEKGIDDPQTSEQCLRCHVTGYNAPPARLTGKYRKEDGVGCESCHGPGGAYWTMAVMKDRAKSVAAGLVIPTEETCRQCHNPDSPGYKEFNFQERLAEIAHPNPKKKAAGSGS